MGFFEVSVGQTSSETSINPIRTSVLCLQYYYFYFFLQINAASVNTRDKHIKIFTDPKLSNGSVCLIHLFFIVIIHFK